MPNIELEMAELAEKLEKSAQPESQGVSNEYEVLVDTIMTLGPEGLKKAAPNLTDNQKQLLKSVLERMQKAQAVSMDSKMPKGGIKVRQNQSEEVTSKKHDEEDEELVMEQAAEHKHQGDNSPEGFEGQVIKAKKSDKEEAEELKKRAPKGVDPAKHERCVKEVKEQGHSVGSAHAICTSSMKKSEETEMKFDEKTLSEMIGRMQERGLEKSKCFDALLKKGHEQGQVEQAWAAAEELSKAKKMKKAEKEKEKESPKEEAKEEAREDAAEKIMEMEAKQHGTKDPKKLVEAEKKEKQAEGKMKKSIVWQSKTNDLLKASTRRGQNCHYSVEEYLLKSEAEQAETIKKGGYLNDAAASEELAKSRRTSLNDMIEKKLDRSSDQVRDLVQLKKSAPKGAFTVQSYNLAEMAASLNMPIEEAAKVLGVEPSELKDE